MKSPRRRRSRTIVVFGVAAWCLAATAACTDTQAERDRFDRQLTPLRVSGPDHVSLVLLASGDDLAAVRPVGPLTDGERWLPPGRWIVETSEGSRTWHYPVTTLGWCSGPDRGGSIVVTVRRPWVGDRPARSDRAFVDIPSGWFLIGDRRTPQVPHMLWLPAYAMMDREVTNGAFREFLRSPHGWSDDASWTDAGVRWRGNDDSRSSARLRPSDPDFDRFGRDDQPVTNVTWHEATAFARWMTRTEGNGSWEFALPDEAEWEKAARGPDDLEYVLCRSISDREAGWFNWRKNPGAATTVAARDDPQFLSRQNRYGLFHMAGNVTEWTRSLDRPFNRVRPFRNDDRNHDEGPGQRVARGGSWYSASTALLSASYRESFPPEHRTQELGFRLRMIRLPGPVR